jgi:hypothetical protein
MIQFDPTTMGATRVVTQEYEVQGLTSSGWTLLAVVQETGVLPVSMTKEFKREGSSWPETRTVTEYHPGTATKYILSKSKDETVAQLAADLEVTRKELERLKKGAHDAAQAILEAQEQTSALEERYTALSTAHTKAMLLISQLNAELATIRPEIVALRDENKVVQKLQDLEDWVIQVARAVPGPDHQAQLVAWAGGRPIPTQLYRKTWAERLEDSD